MIDDVVKRFSPLPLKTKMIILGGGFTGQHIAAVARRLGANVLCSRRKKGSNGADFCFNSDLDQHIPDETFKEATHLVSCIPPLENGKDPVLSKLKKELITTNFQWVGYLSTTGVYGDSQGAWVNEKDIPHPTQKRSIRRLSCEKDWIDSGLPIQILRLPGIYGPGRSALDTLKKGKGTITNKPKQVFSRIHIDDIAGAIMFLINATYQGEKPKIINVSDNLPTNNIDVLKYASSLINYQLPIIESFEIAAKKMSPMALSFWQENRRISNELLCKNLGYSLIHPDFKSGLRDCLKSSKEC